MTRAQHAGENDPGAIIKMQTDKEMLIRIDEKLDSIILDVNQLKKEIYLGNGDQSMKVRLASAEEKLRAINKYGFWALGIIASILGFFGKDYYNRLTATEVPKTISSAINA
jgi:hypothetical protein